jgi:regulator of sigma E protease
MVVYSIADIVTGNFTPDAVSGPVGVVNEIHNTAKVGLLPLLFLMSMITINIGVFNLLPFPALDGGRIFFLLIELIIQRPLNRKLENFINFAGLAILFTIMILITFKDIFSLIG